MALVCLSGCAVFTGATDAPTPNEPVPVVDPAGVIALMPVDNLSGEQAPVEAVGQLLRKTLSEMGLRLLDDETMEEFMRDFRVRSTRGVDSRISRGLKEEAGADALILTSLEIFRETDPPRIAMFSRLVSTGETPRIVWMDGVGMFGDEFPGLLGIGRIDDPNLLLETAVRCLADSLVKSLRNEAEPGSEARPGAVLDCGPRGEVDPTSREARVARRHRPAMSFRSPAIDPNRHYSVAVIPFRNLSDRRNAGYILALHFVNQMARNASLTVIEPGIVREQLLKNRIIMEAGPSLENAKVLSNEEALGADLVLSGSVFDYQDAVGVPKVDYSVKLIQKDGLKVVGATRSHTTGEEGVFFFGQGGIHTAHRLASEMARGTIEALYR